MARRRKATAENIDLPIEAASDEALPDGEGEELVEEGKLICALTGEQRTESDQEKTLQSFIEQLHREYGIPLEDMERDVRVTCEIENEKSGGTKKKTRTISLAVYDHKAERTPENVIRVAVIAPPKTKPDETNLLLLNDILGAIGGERPEVFGIWTNGSDLAFRMRTYDRVGQPKYVELTDIPAPDETLQDLETAERRPLRIATGDSLLRTFKRCHDYIYGNQPAKSDKAFWQLLFLIFAKIYDEKQSRRSFFVGATEGSSDKGMAAVAKRIRALFEEVKTGPFSDVFDGSERIELDDRALTFIAAEIGRYSLLSTDTDAKGLAYEAITSNTLKREKGQFFTPRNVIRMMVEMIDPKPGMKILDPACGSGGFLVVTLNHIRRQILTALGIKEPDAPVPSELKRIDPKLRQYAKECLWGIDADGDLRKAARMNMVMNNDGHGHIFSFNSLAFGVPERSGEEMARFKKAGGDHDSFDIVFTNPPFGAKIPVTDTAILKEFDLGHQWIKDGASWRKGSLHKKVAPEVLFIEACFKFLKPRTGVMALILPNGILGNPGEQMEGVRAWLMREMELLASVDLPGEAFLPQVSVQASCVLLRRRHPDELKHLGPKGPSQGPVFMAIADQCGHGRRGEVKYVRTPDGSEHTEIKKVTERRELRDGSLEETVRSKEDRVVADDMPWIATQYARFRSGKALEPR